MKVYFISGLGADGRVFRHIQLPEGFEPVFINWLQPGKSESLQNYAFRLAESINSDEPFAIIGLSMGGMMAVEIAKQYNPVITILISSVSGSGHLPVYYKAAGKIKLHKLLPVSLLKSGSMIKRFFTSETNEDKELVRQLIRDTDPAFIRWALNAILQWESDPYTGPLIHIHGTGDGILPVRFTRPTHTITKAGHMMVLTKADEINRIVQEVLINR
ncbi:MAG TPA: alpha/beta hydrolase [Chitinophagaceae bacterium]